jgi:protein O-mannosyl-transferase
VKTPSAPASDARVDSVPLLRPLAGVFLATVFFYLPALFNSFIWNDSDYVTAVGLRSFHGLARIWTEVGATQQYYPLLHSAFWVEYHLWGEHPLGYHITNVLLHAVSAVLLALVLDRLLALKAPVAVGTKTAGAPRWDFSGTAWICALLFALHPVHVESVAWITEEKNTLSLVFYLVAALAYLRFDAERSAKTYFLATGLFFCSLLCKTVTASLPAALLVAFWWRRGRLQLRRDVLPLVPWIVCGAAGGLFSGWVERNYGGARGTYFDIPAIERVLVAGRAVCFYAAHVIFPAGLNFIYPRWELSAAAAWQWLFPAVVAAVGFVLWGLRARNRAPLAAFLIFTGSLFPALGFVNLYGARYSWVWDHWQYLPDVGLMALGSAAIAALLNKVARRFPKAKGVGAAVIALLLGTLTWAHCGMFRDNITLYKETIARNPGCWMAYNNLGCELDALPSGREEAISLYEKSLSINPDNAEAHNSLGSDLEKMPGHLTEAIAQYREALRIAPDFGAAHFDLGNALGKEGRTVDSIAEYRLAVQLSPKNAQAYYNLGNALSANGQNNEAASVLQEALRLNPDFAQAHNNLGLVLEKIPGQAAGALAEFEAALRIDPAIPESHANEGLALSVIPGRLDDAVGQYEEAIRLNPDYANAHFYLANALVQKGQVPEAIVHYQEALRVQPDLAEASNNLGMVLCRMGRPSEGMGYIDKAIQLKPGFAPAHFTRGVALLQSGRRDEAAEEFEKVLELRPGDPAALHMLQVARAGQ